MEMAKEHYRRVNQRVGPKGTVTHRNWTPSCPGYHEAVDRALHVNATNKTRNALETEATILQRSVTLHVLDLWGHFTYPRPPPDMMWTTNGYPKDILIEVIDDMPSASRPLLAAMDPRRVPDWHVIFDFYVVQLTGRTWPELCPEPDGHNNRVRAFELAATQRAAAQAAVNNALKREKARSMVLSAGVGSLERIRRTHVAELAGLKLQAEINRRARAAVNAELAGLKLKAEINRRARAVGNAELATLKRRAANKNAENARTRNAAAVTNTLRAWKRQKR